MEAKINIAEILKDKPQGIRLYSPIFGECAFCHVCEDTDDICVKKHNGEKVYFNSEGLYCTLGEVMLFPSKKVRDWLKFTWKKGDMLQHSEYPLTVIFESFEDDTYTSFKCKYCFNFESANKWLFSNNQCSTKHFYKVSDEEAKEFIKKVELNYNGKLKMETLEIEPAQTEFKDGDIVCISGMGYLAYGIVKSIDYSSKKLEYYVLNDMSFLKINDWLSFEDKQIQPITETQQIILFEALAKEDKAWDAEKKQIVDLMPKVELKPFDKVLVRNTDTEEWFPGFFEKFDSTWNNPYHIMNRRSMTDFAFKQCIPYEGNESLLGTTKDVED